MTSKQQHIRHDLLPQKTAKGGIRFTFEGGPDTASVAVAGTFNSWVGDAAPLTRVGANTWQTTVRADPGRHHYKFVVNGSAWIRDPANPWVSEDAQNNSCFTINEFGDVFVRTGAVSQQTPGDLYRRRSAVISPQWLADGVIYQLSVRAFGGTFDGVRARLGHLQELGVSIVWLMPVTPIGVQGRLGEHGDPYAVRDFCAIDPALGDAAGLRALVADLHARGMRVIYDWTLNRAAVDNVLTLSHPEWFTHDSAGQLNYLVPNRSYFAGFNFASKPLRAWLIDAMQDWLATYAFDGLRFDDADITPTDFLDEIRAELLAARADLVLIAHSSDELHHLDACDLTGDAGARETMLRVARGETGADALRWQWEESTYTFPRGALRMRWLEEKEQGRAFRYFGHDLHLAAAAVIMTLDGVPHLMMGQEFNEPRWQDWRSLFDDFSLDWRSFDRPTFDHYRNLIALRGALPALRQGAVHFVRSGAPQLLMYWRSTAQQRILVAVNLSDTACALPPAFASHQLLYARAVAANSIGACGCAIAKA
ncbi:alpha-amylase family glycosyl hydrolase [Massilia sp. CF038]|uniref:alpha-amylase family glycosyl hydrolase n=1 Tax=Massilia sp. CF038 TaxID=1881045 RepID=UPI0009355836|nr:alpha-amylase family glycosyl hydrolase [Massilia sp. CF038]